jgi:hypothetical protein
MTTSTLENNETIQEAIRELEEQWKKENEERMNDYKEKLNVIESYLNERISIHKEVIWLLDKLFSNRTKMIDVWTEKYNLLEKCLKHKERLFEYLLKVGKHCDPSIVKDMFEKPILISSNGVLKNLLSESSKLMNIDHDVWGECMEWIDMEKEVSLKTGELVNNDKTLVKLIMASGIHKEGLLLQDQQESMYIETMDLKKVVDSISKKQTKLTNKSKILNKKIQRKINNLGFEDVWGYISDKYSGEFEELKTPTESEIGEKNEIILKELIARIPRDGFRTPTKQK